MIDPTDYRTTAYNWHGGQWSPLYAFASSGIVEDLNALLSEIKQCSTLFHPPEDKDAEDLALDLLAEMVRALPFDETTETWSAPWRNP